ncbi:MAG: transglycosylase domain-containing protein [Leptospiraceae bacterium]|nr:transglycosylase domain-containing protein [Leptospiraceae bacterium]
MNKSYNSISVKIIGFFTYIVNSILSGKYAFIKLTFILLFLGFANIFLIVGSFDDLSIIPKAMDYEIPSTLYGVNKKGEYEPIAEFYQFSRIVHTLSDFKEETDSPDKRNKVLQCFLSTEDTNFYEHIGLDIRGIIRAFAVNIVAGKIKEGASTITQQVARLKFLNTDRSFIRKAREAWLAVLMEIYYDKNTILEMYLNEIPLGHGTLGVGAAARFYFRKDINSLSWGEAALLASLTTRPKEFSPLVNPMVSSNKVRVIFMKLVENGKMDVKKAEEEYKKFSEYYATLNRSPNDSAYSDRLNKFPYFTEYIRRLLKKQVSNEDLYSGGLKVYSTLNIQHQIEGEKVLSEGLQNQTKISNQRAFKNIDAFDDEYGDIYNVLSLVNDINDFKFKISRIERTFRSVYQEELRDSYSALNLLTGSDTVGAIFDENYVKQSTQDHLLPVEGGIISIRPETGYITAMVGGSGFRSDNQQLRPIQAYRQPGSSFKPLVYATVLDYYGKNPEVEPEKNVTASTLFLDSPLQYLMEDGDEWSPENYSEEYAGFMRLRTALELSKNSVAIRVVEHIGLSKLLPTLTELLRINRPIPKNYSVALGTFEMTPYELTRAYATLASGGKEVFPISMLYITDSKDRMVKDFRPEHERKERRQILSREACLVITSMMSDVIKRGTGKAVLSAGLRRPAAGKTGTTNNFRDAWFVGYTPELVSSVWVGYDTGTISLGKGMSGGVVATPMWGKYMANALKGEPSKDFNFGEGLNVFSRKVCSISGKIPGPQCSKTYEEFFIKDTLGKEICEDHKGYNPEIDIPQDILPPSTVAVTNHPKEKEPVKVKKKKLEKENNPKPVIPVTKTVVKPPQKKKTKKNIFQGDERVE